MAEDASYQGPVHMLQESATLEVGSSGTISNYGTITNQSGATITNASGGTLANAGTMTNTGSITHSGNGYDALQSESAAGISTSSTGQVTLSAYGISQITTSGTSGARALFRLPKPAAVGVEKIIYATNATTAKLAVISTTAAAVLFGSSQSTGHGNYHRLTMNAPEDCVTLRGLTTTKWGVVGNIGSVLLSTPVG